MCILSGDTGREILQTDDDFLVFLFINNIHIFYKLILFFHKVFALRVTRPEHTLDAPSQIRVDDLLTGVYSFQVHHL